MCIRDRENLLDNLYWLSGWECRTPGIVKEKMCIRDSRGDTSIRKRIDCDLYYIENWSIGFDIKIFFLTILKGFINKNAY